MSQNCLRVFNNIFDAKNGILRAIWFAYMKTGKFRYSMVYWLYCFKYNSISSYYTIHNTHFSVMRIFLIENERNNITVLFTKPHSYVHVYYSISIMKRDKNL